MTWKTAVAGAALAVVLAPSLATSVAWADGSLSGVESARAKDRQGAWLSGQQVDSLRRYGGNDDYGPRYGYGGYGRYDYGGDDYYVDAYSYGPVVEFGYYP